MDEKRFTYTCTCGATSSPKMKPGVETFHHHCARCNAKVIVDQVDGLVLLHSCGVILESKFPKESDERGLDSTEERQIMRSVFFECKCGKTHGNRGPEHSPIMNKICGAGCSNSFSIDFRNAIVNGADGNLVENAYWPHVASEENSPPLTMNGINIIAGEDLEPGDMVMIDAAGEVMWIKGNEISTTLGKIQPVDLDDMEIDRGVYEAIHDPNELVAGEVYYNEQTTHRTKCYDCGRIVETVLPGKVRFSDCFRCPDCDITYKEYEKLAMQNSQPFEVDQIKLDVLAFKPGARVKVSDESAKQLNREYAIAKVANHAPHDTHVQVVFEDDGVEAMVIPKNLKRVR